jgi:hypothetical protein
MEGNSMSYDHLGILDGDLMICPDKIPVDHTLQSGNLYVIVTHDRITARRFSGTSRYFRFSCDNPDWRDEELTKEDLLEIWRVDAIYTRSLSHPFKVKERISDLERKFLDLSERLERIEAKKNKRSE